VRSALNANIQQDDAENPMVQFINLASIESMRITARTKLGSVSSYKSSLSLLSHIKDKFPSYFRQGQQLVARLIGEDLEINY
jgi:hypothetical protein